jgi:tetratricopeptide (TPR) repeat protein
MPTLTTGVLWPYVLAHLPAGERDKLLTGKRIPRNALIEFAAYLLEQDRRAEVITVLEPQLASPERHHDEEAAILLDLLCDAYGMSEKGAKRKVKLLQVTTEKAPRSALRSEAWQRLATIYMDRQESERAWRAFHQAQYDHPHAEALSVLEVELLVAEGRMEEARHRAKFWAALLGRNGAAPNDPRLEFLYRIAAADAGDAVSNIEGTGRQLGEWLGTVTGRDLPSYELMPADTGFILTPPAAVRSAECAWHRVFPLTKPFSIQDQPFDEIQVWSEDCEEQWSGFLRAHPESFDSLDILDDLVTALARHPGAQAPRLDDLLLAPVLARHEAILERVCPGNVQVAVPWVIAANRPALRGLVRGFQWHFARGEREPALATAERLVRLNRDDDHCVRYILMNEYLREGRDEQALALAEQYPRDLAPETRFGAVLALVRLHRMQEAERALHTACSDLPKTAEYLLPARVRRPGLQQGTIAGGDDQAWFYRDEMRPVWQQTPGALEWLRHLIQE